MSDVLMDVMKGRRSVRQFTPDAVPAELVKQIVEAASWAPSASNQQPWRFVAVMDEDTRQAMATTVEEKLREISSNIKSDRARKQFASYSRYFLVFEQAPLCLCMFAEPNDALITRLLKRYGDEEDAASFRSSGNIQSCAAAMQNALLMAHSLGLGGCWMTGPLIVAQQIGQIVGAKEPWELIAVAALGYPKKLPSPPPRPNIDDILQII